MADRAWKVFERQVAKRLHGKRWLERGDGTPDVNHPLLSPECKYTEGTLGKKYIRGLLTKAIDQFNVDKGRNPKDLDELVKERYISSVPNPPFGTKIVYDAASGRVNIEKQ